jgi:plasmid stabilization system protein ParE
LEARFISCVEDAIRRLCESPLRCRVWEDDVRGCLTHVFPYVVLYTIESDYILIVAVVHCHREPGYWRERVA